MLAPIKLKFYKPGGENRRRARALLKDETVIDFDLAVNSLITYLRNPSNVNIKVQAWPLRFYVNSLVEEVNTCRHNHEIYIDDPDPDTSNFPSSDRSNTIIFSDSSSSEDDEEPVIKKRKSDSGSQIRSLAELIGWIERRLRKFIVGDASIPIRQYEGFVERNPPFVSVKRRKRTLRDIISVLRIHADIYQNWIQASPVVQVPPVAPPVEDEPPYEKD